MESLNLKEIQTVLAEEGIQILTEVSQRCKIKTYLSNAKGFCFSLPTGEVSVHMNSQKEVSVYVDKEFMSFNLSTIEKCNINVKKGYTLIEFFIEGSFRMCFEYLVEYRKGMVS